MTKPQFDLAVLVPLKREWDSLQDQFKRRAEHQVDGQYYYELTHKASRKTIIATLLGDDNMGTPESARRCEALVNFAEVGVLAVVGIAGSLSDEVRLGDVVIADQVYEYEAETKAVPVGKHKYKRLPSMRCYDVGGRFRSAVNAFPISATGKRPFRAWHEQCKAKWNKLKLRNCAAAKLGRSVPEYFLGHLASGNTVAAATAFKKELVGRDRKLRAIEMEAAGLARVARAHDKDFIIVRGISDLGDETKGKMPNGQDEQWREFAAHNAVSYLANFLSWPGSDEAFPSLQDGAFQRYFLKLDAKLKDSVGREKEILDALRQAVQEPRVSYRNLRDGCVELEVEGPAGSYERLLEGFRSGAVTSIAGIPIVRVYKERTFSRVHVVRLAGAEQSTKIVGGIPKSTRFSTLLGIDRDQSELDFVDATPGSDTKLFVDPHALSQRTDLFSRDCHVAISSFFDEVLRCVVDHQDARGEELLSHLSEPYETCLGWSRGHTHGRGIGKLQGKEIYERLRRSDAVRTGVLSDLGEGELFVEGIGPDKISDITTNLIRRQLIEFTQEQCDLFGVVMQETGSGALWDHATLDWTEERVHLPIINGQRVLFVPKGIVRPHLSMNAAEYYRNFVLSHFEERELAKRDSPLVRRLKDGTRKVDRRALRRQAPLSKGLLRRFTEDHPDALARYKRAIGTSPALDNRYLPSNDDERRTAARLQDALASIPRGEEGSKAYYDTMKGALEVLLYPEFQRPAKLDENGTLALAYENAAETGPLYAARVRPKLNVEQAVVLCNNGAALERAAAKQQLDESLVARSMFLNVGRQFHGDRTTEMLGRPSIQLDDQDIRSGLAAVAEGDARAMLTRIRTMVFELI